MSAKCSGLEKPVQSSLPEQFTGGVWPGLLARGCRLNWLGFHFLAHLKVLDPKLVPYSALNAQWQVLIFLALTTALSIKEAGRVKDSIIPRNEVSHPVGQGCGS